jgi:hypothetical protein
MLGGDWTAGLAKTAATNGYEQTRAFVPLPPSLLRQSVGGVIPVSVPSFSAANCSSVRISTALKRKQFSADGQIAATARATGRCIRRGVTRPARMRRIEVPLLDDVTQCDRHRGADRSPAGPGNFAAFHCLCPRTEPTAKREQRRQAQEQSRPSASQGRDRRRLRQSAAECTRTSPRDFPLKTVMIPARNTTCDYQMAIRWTE